MTMILQVRVPVRIACLYGKYRNRISYTDVFEPLVTTVHAVRRPRVGDGLDPSVVEVDAFIPENRRRGIDVQSHRWVTPEILRVTALIAENKKTLAPFLASGDVEWGETQLK